MTQIQELIDFWRAFQFTRGQIGQQLSFVHEDDRAVVERHPLFAIDGPVGDHSWENYREDWYGPGYWERAPSTTEVSLLPHPYAGNIKKASAIILSLNGGASDSWYRETYLERSIRTRALDELAQKAGDAWNGKHSGFCIENCGTSAFSYWGKRNLNLARKIAEELTNNDIAAAYDLMATQIATLELVAYPSRNGSRLVPPIPQWLRQQIADLRKGKFKAVLYANDEQSRPPPLESSIRILKALWSDIVPAALADKKTVIITRRSKSWGFTPDWERASPNVVVYPSTHAQSASLGPDTKGGRAIRRRLRAVV